ncbi:glutathione S-transferase N-terminal domain-containing protein [Variovorax sp. Sphag1AA]|uniref:glutathione S-transferase N-terminal domain-containing protein n=1 Tax=Variovorax sp. Sphag1AA TaxID=2587027 RepID=UPI00160BF21A|nr:glutathione S-transferase N-terminal domain-containing protein [Variovorax sp. Sphag1AA]MBB3181038.1 glutathione S-transferase [Variovorax sp. Sphag1AA]
MKLKFGPNSPYVRKVMVLAIELGLEGRIEKELVNHSPYEPDQGVLAINPLGKIPAFVTDEGMALFDSDVICEYLSVLAGDTVWFPAERSARWHALRYNALANGLLEAAQLVRLEQVRPVAFRYGNWVQAQTAKVLRAIASLESKPPAGVDIGSIAVACALGWLDYRFAELAWREAAPQLAEWFGEFSGRVSFASTRHRGQK